MTLFIFNHVIKNKTIMNIEKTLTEAGNYFKSKVLAGDYEIAEIGICDIMLNIDNYKIRFYVSIGSDYDFNILSDIVLIPHMTFTQNEIESIWVTLKPRYDKFKEDLEREQKELQYERLKNELGY